MTALAIAHRAGNSLAGLHAANALGVDVIECDVHEHRGRLEVRHLKTAGPLPFLWDRWELASASAPRLGLAELLEADRHDTTFMLDIKGRRVSAARSVARLLHESGHHRPVLVCGRWWPSVDTLAKLPFVRPVLSSRNRTELARLTRRLEAGPPVHGVSVHRSLLTREAVSGLHRHVEVVMTWPVNDLAALDAVLDIGVTGVISDEPAILSELRARQATDD
ncbi:glycerophosphoryl diester phosphodiesterase [Nocardioides ginsengisegetis]|uniref:Glycerophosphoryl diester phosphodiesterase n=1 Tax=Nocardioides ginsengisegetis TaxID=661491 RepID=A0A7W3IZI2_9ACTN|nr:glycerophosphodiester phosphodiesterase [Nocardioides ginsengisegetis]MBA8803543.1 glycerophosphoryl diester phosphodiesterase [Nocardioides ginsengisegetis]